ncbi:MAG: response regulator [Dehalococcoidia bacterium]|nr:response regulator [Dehalococcoidia bacterium]
MANPLSVLILEDDPSDAELLLEELRRSGFAAKGRRVEDEAGYIKGLARQPDLILADYTLPQFDAVQALRLLQSQGLDIPFIVVTGTLEESAIECMKQGAADYVLKEKLGRLGPAVTRALELKRLRDEKRRTEEALHESEAKYWNLLRAAPDAIVVADSAGRILLANDQTERLFGYGRDELLGQPIEALLPERLRERHVAHRSAYASAPRMRLTDSPLDILGQRKDGSEFPADVVLSPLQTEGGLTVTAIVRDVTERKRAEEELRQLSHRLLALQEEDRRQVSYDIHDGLGQLITAAALHVDALDAMVASSDLLPANAHAELRSASDCIHSAVVDMRRMISDLGPLLLEDLGFLEASKRLLEDTAARAGWEAEFEGELGSGLLEQPQEIALFRVVQEALSNARKHSGTRKVRLTVQHGSGTLRVAVQDWGSGFDAENVLRQPGEGHHIGLVSMRERAALTGGECIIDSSPGQGTTVTISVPIAERTASAASPASKELVTMTERKSNGSGTAGKIRVLIADDHAMVRDGLRSILSVDDIEIVGEAGTGAEAVEAVQTLEPDLVLMDIRMPDMDGLAATEAIKQCSPDTSVIVVTSYESKEYLRRAIEAGAAGYLLKGTPREGFITAIRAVRSGGSLIDARLLGELLHDMGLAEKFENAALDSLQSLSPREREVLALLVEGLTNKEIAQQMHYSVGTVKNVVQRVIEKLGVSDRTQAAVYAVRSGLPMQ